MPSGCLPPVSCHLVRLSACLIAVLLAVSPRAQDAPAPPLPSQVSVARLRQEIHRADQFLLQGRFEDARAAMQLVTSVLPDHAGAWLLYSKALSGTGRHVEAKDAAVRAVALLEADSAERRAGWGPGAFYLQLGRSLAYTGELARAESALRRADREQPDSAAIQRELGSALLRLGQDQEAATTLTRAASLDASSPRTQVELGNALLRVGKVSEAEAAFRAAAALAPLEPEPHFGLATAAGERGDEAAREAALAEFERLNSARQERADQARILEDALRVADEHLIASRFAEAASAYEATLASPVLVGDAQQATLILVDLGRSRRLAGDILGAVEAFEQAIEKGPRLGAAHLELGNLLAGEGLVDEAFPHLLRATELDALMVAPHVSLAMAWAVLGRLDEALAESAKASLLAPEDLGLRKQYVDLLAAAGRMSEAQALAGRGGIGAPGRPMPPGDAGAPAPNAQGTSGAPGPRIPVDVPLEPVDAERRGRP